MAVDLPYVILDSIAIFLVVIPMPWHITAWNSATCYMMLWTLLGCIIHLVNSIIWYGNLSNPSPVYCDITTKIQIATSIALPLSSLCINRRLFKIANMQTVTITKGEKKRAVIFDTILAVLLPMIFMVIHYTQQGHRYDIMEDYGCWPATYLTPLAYAFVFTPPIAVSTISLVYCTLSIRMFLRRRHEFNSILQSSAAGMNSHRYFRLMALASSEIVIGLPSSVYFLATNLKFTGVNPWISWDDTHWGFSRIVYYPRIFFQQSAFLRSAFEITRWAFPFIAFLFFSFFGFADEARANYRRAFYAVMRPFGIKPSNSTSSTGNSASMFSKTLKGRDRGLSGKTLDDDIVDSLPQYSAGTGTAASASYSQFLSMPLDMTALDVNDKNDEGGRRTPHVDEDPSPTLDSFSFPYQSPRNSSDHV